MNRPSHPAGREPEGMSADEKAVACLQRIARHRTCRRSILQQIENRFGLDGALRLTRANGYYTLMAVRG